jgi:hypothetical protein
MGFLRENQKRKEGKEQRINRKTHNPTIIYLLLVSSSKISQK